MKIHRGTNYNEKIISAVKEKMNSWQPPNSQAMALWPIFAGDSRYPADYWVSHKHFENLDIQIIQEGNLKITHETGSTLLEPGSAAIIPFGAHKLETGPAGFCVKKCIGFSGMALKILIKTLELDSFYVIQDFYSPEIAELHERIASLLHAKELETVPELSILAYTFLIKIATKRQTNELPEELIQCRHFIEQNIFQKLSLNDMSNAAGCSKTTLSRLFKQHLKCTPVQFMINLRINYAKNLLEKKSIPVKEIAELCGYQNQLYFSNDFRKHTGLSPRAYSMKQRDSIPG